jgi:hypothetical protein
MNVTIENRLHVSIHVTAVRHNAVEVTLIISSMQRTVFIGEVLRRDCLFPGTALALRNFNDRTNFAAVIEGFDGSTVTMEIGKSADDPDVMLVILRNCKTTTS